MATSAPPTTALRQERTASNRPARRSNALRESAEARPFGFVQAKLAVGPANDRFEQEADAVADRVVRMDDARPIGSTPASVQPAPATLQRLCHACEEETLGEPEGQEQDETVRPQADVGFAAAPLDGDTTATINAMRGRGQPLPSEERSFFEPRFGRDFGEVRIHADAAAGKAARAIGARAFTIGRDVAFAAGQYRPGTPAGRLLLAHELTHVVQQGAAEARSAPVGNDIAETKPTTTPGATGVIQRAGDPAAIPPGFGCPTDLTPGAPAGTDVVFTVDDATITPAHTTLLTTFLASWLAGGGVDDIKVHGYASVDGDQGHNWTLSCNRARAVEAELLRLGIPAVRISVVAHGESTDFGSAAGPNRHAVVESSPPGPIQFPLVIGILTPRDDFAGRSTTRFGVGEIVDLSFLSLPLRPAADFGGLEWRIAVGGGALTAVTNVGTATYTAPGTTDTVRLELRVAGGATAGRVISTRTISIVEPNTVRFRAVPGSAPNTAPTGGTIPAGTFGAGFLANVFVGPNDVSFQRVEFGEGTVMSVVTPPGSFFGAPVAHPVNVFGFGHGGNAVTGTPVSPPSDRIATAGPPSGSFFGRPTCGTSDFVWAIPWEFRLGTTGPRRQFSTGTHHQTSSFFCVATIEKSGPAAGSGSGPFCRRIDGTVC